MAESTRPPSSGILPPEIHAKLEQERKLGHGQNNAHLSFFKEPQTATNKTLSFYYIQTNQAMYGILA